MSKARRNFRGTGAVLAVLLCGVGLGALAYSIEVGPVNRTQVAAGMAADAMCKGGKDAHCQCNKGIDPKTGKCGNVSGGGKIGCPCRDITSGDVAAEGKCATVGKCLAEKADGKPPELPKLPEMPPKQPEQPQPCSGIQQATTTGASSTAPTDPNCQGGASSYGTQEAGGFWSSVWDTTNPFSSGSSTSSSSGGSSSNSSTVWSNLLQSLGISNSNTTGNQNQNTQKPVTYTSTTTGGVSSKGNASNGVNTQNTTEFSGSGSTFSYVDPSSPASQTVLAQMKATLQKMLDIVGKMFSR